MKPTDGEISEIVEKYVNEALESGKASELRMYMQWAAKEARDKACEWVPVEKELPDLKVLQKHRTGTDYVSDKVIMVIGGQSFSGYYRFDQATGYEKYYFEDQDGEEFEVDEVEYWQYAPQPPKSE